MTNDHDQYLQDESDRDVAPDGGEVGGDDPFWLRQYCDMLDNHDHSSMPRLTK